MAVVRSFGALQAMTAPNAVFVGENSGSLGLYGAHLQTYAAIYRTQPNVRTVVDFLARNTAQLGIHVFRRVSDVDRERLPDHELAGWLSRPNPATTRYRLIETLMGDLGIYFNAYWLKVRANPLGLVRLPPEQMSIEGVLQPTKFVWTDAAGIRKEFAPEEIVHFGGYDPCNQLMGLSPMETLRRILAEESAAGDHREAFWRNAARIDGVVTRPADKPRYSPTQVTSWQEQWQATYGAQSGKTVLLQDGETFTPTSWSAKDAEYVSARKLTREECAAAYHVPLPMVGILENATYSNIKEQHKHLYQDTLGPWHEMIVQEIERQLLPEAKDTRSVYLEFNIAAKLAGSFEEQASALQMAIGRPWMTVNEGRGKQNLPSMKDDPTADQIAPQQGGPASNDPADPPTEPRERRAAEHVAPIVQAAQVRQRARLNKLPADQRPAAFQRESERWNRELEADLLPLMDTEAARALARQANAATYTRLQDEAAQ